MPSLKHLLLSVPSTSASVCAGIFAVMESCRATQNELYQKGWAFHLNPVPCIGRGTTTPVMAETTAGDDGLILQ